MKYKSKVSGEVLTEEQFKGLLLREYKDMWDNNLNLTVEEFKEDGKTFEDYVSYMEKYDYPLGEEFEIIE